MNLTPNRSSALSPLSDRENVYNPNPMWVGVCSVRLANVAKRLWRCKHRVCPSSRSCFLLSRAALREFPQPMVDLGFNKRCFVLFSSSRLAWCSVYRTVACVAYASLTGSDKANPLTPALLVQLGISLSPGQQYIIHSEYLSHIWKRQQRKKKKEDRQTEAKRGWKSQQYISKKESQRTSLNWLNLSH